MLLTFEYANYSRPDRSGINDHDTSPALQNKQYARQASLSYSKPYLDPMDTNCWSMRLKYQDGECENSRGK